MNNLNGMDTNEMNINAAKEKRAEEQLSIRNAIKNKIEAYDLKSPADVMTFTRKHYGSLKALESYLDEMLDIFDLSEELPKNGSIEGLMEVSEFVECIVYDNKDFIIKSRFKVEDRRNLDFTISYAQSEKLYNQHTHVEAIDTCFASVTDLEDIYLNFMLNEKITIRHERLLLIIKTA